jgi:hypothetical protein
MATDVGTLALLIAAVKLTQASSFGLINKVLVEVLAGIIILAPATIPILLEVTAPATLALLVRTLTRLVKPRRRLVQAILGLGFWKMADRVMSHRDLDAKGLTLAKGHEQSRPKDPVSDRRTYLG